MEGREGGRVRTSHFLQVVIPGHDEEQHHVIPDIVRLAWEILLEAGGGTVGGREEGYVPRTFFR